MMNFLKKKFALLLAVMLCLSLTACTDGSNDEEFPDIGGTDWRTTGVWRADGTITRDGEDTDVLVCIHAEDAAFYYDTEDQTLFGSVDYPVAIEGDAWEAFQSIDFADLNGDGNSDVTMKFHDGGAELLMVWFWDAESEQFVYQPEESQPGEEDDGQGDLIADDDGQSDLVPDDYGPIPVLTADALPFTNVETLQSESHEDGTYYYESIVEDGLIIVVNTALPHEFDADSQTLEDYLTDCALSLRVADNSLLQNVEANDAYTANMTFPVYIVTFTAGGNEDAREWTVFAMDTDRCTYLYGFGAMLDEADDVRPVYQDVFAGLYLSDGE